MLKAKTVQEAATVLGALKHPTRLRIVEALETGPRSVTELMRVLAMKQADVSKHLMVLRTRGIARATVKGNIRIYRLSRPEVLKILNCIRQCEKK